MIVVKVKDDKQPVDYDYVVSSVNELDELTKVIYKPIFGSYFIGLTLNDLHEIKFLMNNSEKYNHLNIHLNLSEKKFKEVCLAMPHVVVSESKSMFDYLIEGIAKRNLLMKKKVVYKLYSSISKSYEEIDETLDLLYDKFGSYIYITEEDLAKHIVLNNIVYPRSVLIDYINLSKHRKFKLEKCLNDISPDIVIASMVKNIKKLHKQKMEYLNTGLGNKFIKELNTRNLNLMYYVLVTSKPYNLNDITILLELYERGIRINDILYDKAY